MYLLLLFLVFHSVEVEPYKILVYTNLAGHSHVKFQGAVADTLTDAGHNLTVLMPIFEEPLRNKTSLKSTKNVIFVEPSEELLASMDGLSELFADRWTTDIANPLSRITETRVMSKIFGALCKNVLSQPGLIERLKAENFDLAITEPLDTCAYALFEAINIRAHVAVLSASRFEHVSDVIGQPLAASYVPGLQSPTGERMDMIGRIWNYFHYLGSSYFFNTIGDTDHEIAKTILPITRSWREVLPEASFVLVNLIPILDFPAPTFDKIVPIGGLSVKTDKKSLKLDEKWSKILDLRKHNVLISFGSVAKSVDMPAHYKRSLLEVFKSMTDTTFIWKYEDAKDTFANHLDNVYLGGWLPQNELLADKRLSLFITHGGLGSTTEVAVMGKPAIMVPLFADQGRNAQILKRHGGALVIERKDLADSGLVKKTLETIIKDQSYQKNAERLAEMLTNQPTNPKETLVKYVEFAARFGKLPSLDNYGRHQSYIEYFFLDIIAIGILISLIIMYIFYRILKAIMRRMFCFNGTGSLKNKKD